MRNNPIIIVKLRSILMAVVMLCLATGLSAQNIDIKIKDAPIEVALKYLQNNYGYSFSIKTDDVDVKRAISINLKDASIEDVLANLFSGQNVEYSVNEKTILVVPKYMQSNKSKSHILSGIVTDENGEVLVGASVVEKGTSNGTTADLDGSYRLKLQSRGDGNVIFSFMGYRDKEVKFTSSSNIINVTMHPAMAEIDKVVVVGYGTQRKANLTGSIATVDFSEQVDSRPTMNTSSALAGLAAGLQVMQSSGQPGSDGATLRIRGNGTLNSNSPLVLVDGIEWSMDNINSNDVASITVLKDASSTAIYGSRAANGVILVTTKKGKGASHITYSFSGIFQSPYNKLAWVSDYAQHMELVNEAADNIGQAHIFSDSSISAWLAADANSNGTNEYGVKNYISYPNTDWFKELFTTGFSQEHNISIDGSTDKVSYMFSLGYLDDNGVMNKFDEIDSGTEKVDFRTNMEVKVNKWLKVGTRTFGMKQDYGLANISNAFSYLYQTTPGIWPGTPDKWGRPADTAEESSSANNLFAQMAGPAGHNTVYRLNTSFYAIAELMKGLNFEVTGNYSPIFQDVNRYSRKNGKWDYTTDTRYSESNLDNATNSNRFSMNYRTNTQMLLRYNSNLGKDQEFGALLGFTTNYYKSRSYSVTKVGAPDWNVTEMSSYTDYSSSSSSTSEWSLMSFFGRINYAAKNRYLFEANLRYDGSSRFSSDSRWGLFPSFSAGWRIKEESFLKDVDWLSNLKIRGSWGITGNNNSGNYAWQATYNTVNVVVDGSDTIGLLQTELGNSSLKWETTYTTDLGIDYGMFENKLSGELDLYVKDTKGILFRPSIYETMGEVTGSYSNIAAIRNKGVELTLNYGDRIGRDFKYSVGLNLAYNVGVVTKYKGQLEKYWEDNGDGTKTYVNNISDVAESGFGGRILEGHLLGEHYIYKTYSGTGKGYDGTTLDINAGPKDGMIRTERDMAWVKAMIDAGYSFRGVTTVSKDQLWYGDLIYADTNGNGNYGDTNDMSFNGHINTPKWNAGLNISMSWKGFDLYALFAGSFGFYLTWTTEYYNTTKVTNGHGISERIADDHYFYDPDNLSDERTNINGTYPRFMLNDDQGNSLASDFREYRGDYVKLKNLQLGYTLPQNITQKFVINKMRLYVSLENIFTITEYPGLDPEIGTTIGYPLSRNVSLGAQITF
ncbi:MAG: TonB-dependent receptor [Bacteroidales bacterium]|jgi:TonB-linked SusC/RagA family outer membrane protein|nr:TonB-dependent receptor [Bacteroidales bacterium]MCI2121530.1 TonB-dependent receptor [Bacteroidales bacterium]MCI2145528.1 TonB-dependent receptor [Bacteroidales bacterium]